MSVTSICDAYVSQIEATYSYEMFEDYEPSGLYQNTDSNSSYSNDSDESTDEESEESSTNNIGKLEVIDFTATIKAAKNSVNAAFGRMFHSDDQENANWLLLNSYPEIFRNTQRYEESTYTFYDDLTYTYLGYQYFQSLAKADKGRFISDAMDSNITAVIELINKWQVTYDESPLSTYTVHDSSGDSDSGTITYITVTKQEQFWNQNLATFKSELGAFKTAWETLKTDFANLFSNIDAYLELGQSASYDMSVLNSFSNTDTKTITNGYSNVDELYSYMNGKTYFGEYSSEVEEYCSMYYSSREYAEEHLYDFQNWEYNMEYDDPYLSIVVYSIDDNKSHALNLATSKIYMSKILEDDNFYSQAESLNSVATDIMKRWNIY